MKSKYRGLYTYNPKNAELEKIFDRLTCYPGVRVKGKLAQNISRNKTIRFLRDNNYMVIAKDFTKGNSLLFFPPNVKVKKKENGNGFFFEVF